MAQRVVDFADGFTSGSAPSAAGINNTPTVVSSGPYTVLSTDAILLCSGTFTVNFPAAASNSGRTLIVVNASSGVITEDGNASETLNGALTQTLDTQYSAHTWYCNGTAWFLIA